MGDSLRWRKMKHEIEQFLKDISLKNSERRVRGMVADHFGGITTSKCRYVKIGDTEYRITKNPDNVECGWDVKEMDWGLGNDWRFAKPY